MNHFVPNNEHKHTSIITLTLEDNALLTELFNKAMNADSERGFLDLRQERERFKNIGHSGVSSKYNPKTGIKKSPSMHSTEIMTSIPGYERPSVSDEAFDDTSVSNNTEAEWLVPQIPPSPSSRFSSLYTRLSDVNITQRQSTPYAKTEGIINEYIAVPESSNSKGENNNKGGTKKESTKKDGNKNLCFIGQIPKSKPPTSQVNTPPAPPPPKGKVIIHLIRHARGYHNLGQRCPDSWRVPDPPLTPVGMCQCTNLKKIFEPMNRITHILCSPLTRTLQTACYSLEPIICGSAKDQKGLQIVAWPLIREFGNGTASTGTEIQKLVKNVENKYKGVVDFTMVPEGWEKNREEQWERIPRCELVRKELYEFGQEALKVEGGQWKHVKFPRRENESDDVEIAVVAHADFFKDLEENTSHRFLNANYYTYLFASQEMVARGFSPYKLVETQESQDRVRTMADYGLAL